MTKEEYQKIEIGDICSGAGWRGQSIRGTVIGMSKRYATVRGERSMMTVSYKKLTLIERDPTSTMRLKLIKFVPMLRELLEAMEE